MLSIIQKDTEIKRLMISIETKLIANDNLKEKVEIDFDGRSPMEIEIQVQSQDRSVGLDILSVSEEQVERTLQSGLFYNGKQSINYRRKATHYLANTSGCT